MANDLIDNDSMLQVNEAKPTMTSRWDSNDHTLSLRYHSASMEPGSDYQHTEHDSSCVSYQDTSKSCRMSTASTKIFESSQVTPQFRPVNEGHVLGAGEETDLLGIGAQFHNTPHFRCIPHSQVASHVHDEVGLYSNTGREPNEYDIVARDNFSLADAGPGLPRLMSDHGDGGYVMVDMGVALAKNSGWEECNFAGKVE